MMRIRIINFRVKSKLRLNSRLNANDKRFEIMAELISWVHLSFGDLNKALRFKD